MIFLQEKDLINHFTLLAKAEQYAIPW